MEKEKLSENITNRWNIKTNKQKTKLEKPQWTREQRDQREAYPQSAEGRMSLMEGEVETPEKMCDTGKKTTRRERDQDEEAQKQERRRM